MSGLTWLHISDRLWKGEKEFDRQVIRAALIRDIRGRTATGPDLSVIGSHHLYFFEKLPSEIEKSPGSEEEVQKNLKVRVHG